MAKTHRIGKQISMNAEAYDKFVSLSKQEQLDYVTNNSDPKDVSNAEKILKHVPNGDNISSTGSREAKADNAANDKSGSNQTSSKGRGSVTEKS